MATFTLNQKLSTRSICNSEATFEAFVIKRTAKTVTIYIPMDGEKRCKIHQDDNGGEFIYPHGRYSMCPIFRA